MSRRDRILEEKCLVLSRVMRKNNSVTYEVG